MSECRMGNIKLELPILGDNLMCTNSSAQNLQQPMGESAEGKIVSTPKANSCHVSEEPKSFANQRLQQQRKDIGVIVHCSPKAAINVRNN